MKNVEKIYQQLTNVDLEQQRRIWDERAQGYWGEYYVFRELFLKVHGKSKFLMNLHLPTENGKSTEIDLIMIHEIGIFVFEIKHYKGTIYGGGTDKYWTQYFRTVKNNTFLNPIYQNGYHVRALLSQLPDACIHSVVVFTNAECTLKVTNSNPHVKVSTLQSLIADLSDWIHKLPYKYNADKINDIFAQLQPFSPLKETAISLASNTPVIPFYKYINNLKTEIEDKLRELSAQKQQLESKSKELARREEFRETSRKKKWWISLIVVILCCGLITFLVCRGYQASCDTQVAAAQNELAEMEKKFERVDTALDQNQISLSNMIRISDVTLQPSHDLKNTAVFSCTLTNTGKEYGILLNEDTKYIIMFSDGVVREYEMFGERMAYSELGNRLSGTNDTHTWKHSGTLKALEIADIQSIDTIVYIKITNVSVWKLYENNNKPLIDGLELELYLK